MAKARQYQTGKLVLLKQCYHCANMGTVHGKIENGVFNPPPPPPNIRVNKVLKLTFLSNLSRFSCQFKDDFPVNLILCIERALCRR